MSSDSGLIASFSQDGSQFAFQAGIAQKSSIDIYPLDASNNYEVNSSLVNHLDYENHDLNSSEKIFVGWCSENADDSAATSTKRKLDNDEGEEISRNTTNSFVSVFEDGQVVTFSSTGKDITNIYRNKDKILAVDTTGSYIWILDSDECVKKLEHNKTKPIKTFHLTDGKNEEIIQFQVLHFSGVDSNEDGIYLAIASEQKLYIVDPSKRRPTTVATFDVFGTLCCTFSEDGKYLVVATIDKVTVYDFESKSEVQSWELQVERLVAVNDFIFALNVNGNLSVLKISEEEPLSTIVVQNSEVIDFKQVSNSIMLAWLNVNEPNFKLLSIDNIIGNKEIIINETSEAEKEQEESKEQQSAEAEITETVPEVTKIKKTKKVTKSEQTELAVKLIKALSHDKHKSDDKAVIDILLSESWNDQRIISFINTQLTTESLTGALVNKIVAELQSNVWIESDNLNIWLKWTLMLKNIPHSTIYDKKPKKNMKHLKNNLKASSQTLSTLLGIQGRLDLLNRQATLREELSKLSLDDGNASAAIDEGEEGEVAITNSAQENADEESMIYVNGENDVFVDASDHVLGTEEIVA
ncbi:Utp9 protein [Maudiozyma humilis]|uniref:Utp9 protein n=1 Tax=Maudiozyma humilis TaxID=51915 RepID=A0AAV5S0I6_MAUHU|nr:Utp9 protein [Kazachstania humilis]